MFDATENVDPTGNYHSEILANRPFRTSSYIFTR